MKTVPLVVTRRFVGSDKADNDYHSPSRALRVVREAGAPCLNVENDTSFEIRSVPFESLCYASELKEQSIDGATTVMCYIPDDGSLEDFTRSQSEVQQCVLSPYYSTIE
jgi:hypothetical protein